MSVNMFKRMYVDKPDRFIALVYYKTKIIGQAIYLRRQITESKKYKGEYISFVLQLVVAKEFQGNKLGRRLLFSIWGMSNDYAWGIMTSNPRTISILEKSRLRKINKDYFWKRKDVIFPVIQDVFDDEMCLKSIKDKCRIDTHFPIDHSKIQNRIETEYPDGTYPFINDPLQPSEEWLAFVFSSQKMNANTEIKKTLTETNPDILREIYSHLDTSAQFWASNTVMEIDFLIENRFIKTGDRILDLGCGNGRHVIELGNRGYFVRGVDFIEHNSFKEEPLPQSISFERADVLQYRPQEKYDVVLCLYDVLGAYSSEVDNQKIVDTIYESLKDNGIAIITVLNMHLTEKICARTSESVLNKIDVLSRLPVSRSMQKTGNCFDGKYLLIDKSTNIIYHKEYFDFHGRLPVEYIIPERRFTVQDLERLFSKRFSIELMQFVKSGDWKIDPKQKAQSPNSKEILLVVRKKRQYNLSPEELLKLFIDYLRQIDFSSIKATRIF